jgi:hypothetical protein
MPSPSRRFFDRTTLTRKTSVEMAMMKAPIVEMTFGRLSPRSSS